VNDLDRAERILCEARRIAVQPNDYIADLTDQEPYQQGRDDPDLWLSPAEVLRHRDPDNRTFPERVEAHKQRILERGGIRHPISIITDGKHAYIEDGHHRALAAQQLGMDRVPVRVTPADGVQWARVLRGPLKDWWNTHTWHGDLYTHPTWEPRTAARRATDNRKTEMATVQMPIGIAHYYRMLGDQPRSGLTDDIRAHGIREPLTLNTDGETGYLEDGHHRLDSAADLGMTHVPVRVNWINDAGQFSAPIEDHLRGILRANPPMAGD